jgi:hypothetical protein
LDPNDGMEKYIANPMYWENMYGIVDWTRGFGCGIDFLYGIGDHT